VLYYSCLLSLLVWVAGALCGPTPLCLASCSPSSSLVEVSFPLMVLPAGSAHIAGLLSLVFGC